MRLRMLVLAADLFMAGFKFFHRLICDAGHMQKVAAWS